MPFLVSFVTLKTVCRWALFMDCVSELVFGNFGASRRHCPVKYSMVRITKLEFAPSLSRGTCIFLIALVFLSSTDYKLVLDFKC